MEQEEEKKKAPGIPPSAATKSTIKQCFNVLKQIMNSESVAKVVIIFFLLSCLWIFLSIYFQER